MSKRELWIGVVMLALGCTGAAVFEKPKMDHWWQLTPLCLITAGVMQINTYLRGRQAK